MSLDDPMRYHNIEKPDLLEMVKNRQATVAMKLFNKILGDFSHHDFTLQDIKDSFNDQVSKKNYGQRYGKSHLDKLVEMDLLVYDEDNKTYSINHASSSVARIVENG